MPDVAPLFRRRRREPVVVGDPAYDAWEVVRDFEDLESALAWKAHLGQTGIPCVLTSDWPLERSGRGDIALRVPPERWSEAEEALGENE